MKKKLTCPVCERPEIEGNTCPNCETNLSLFWMLAELPVATQTAFPVKIEKPAFKPWLFISVGILLLLVGLSLGASGNYLISKHQQLVAKTSTFSPNSIQNTSATQLPINNSHLSPKPSTFNHNQEAKLNSCGSFYYTVRPKDSLSLIAWRFYGDSKSWLFIVEANPKIKERIDDLKIGEMLLVPNTRENCP